MANMTYEEKFDAVQAFCDKYESLIDEAPEGSDLWAFRELDDAFDSIGVVERGYGISEKFDSIRVHLINAMLYIAERWSYETDVELECVDPKTGEVTVIGGNQVDEPKHGEWVETEPDEDDRKLGIEFSIKCSICHNENSHLDFNENCEITGKTFWKSRFCPNCGADMRGKEV